MAGVVVRPWLYDNFDDWLQRLKGPPHKCAFIFVDNSGIDIILGVFPFACLLLKRGTHVRICVICCLVLFYSFSRSISMHFCHSVNVFHCR